LKIELDKLVNKLQEVIVSRSGLSGNLEKDLQNIPYDVIDPSKKLGIEVFEGEPEEKIPTLLQTFGYGTGIYIEPLYKHISGYYKKLKNKRGHEKETKTVDNILYFYGASFFQTNYNIKSNEVYNFLFFCVETEESLITKFENENYNEVLNIFNKKSLNFNE